MRTATETTTRSWISGVGTLIVISLAIARIVRARPCTATKCPCLTGKQHRGTGNCKSYCLFHNNNNILTLVEKTLPSIASIAGDLPLGQPLPWTDKTKSGVTPGTIDLKIKVHQLIDEIPADEWNRLVRDNQPFLRHAFLAAMEHHACVGMQFGWLPRHIAVYEDERLIAAMPLYEKHNSYGEFVFDHAWVDAYRRNGLPYFPKLVSAIPYTPATGQRLLCLEQRRDELLPILLKSALELTEQLGASGFHCLFPYRDEHQFMEQQQLLTRHDCQFHWRNEDYREFDDFLNRLTAKKRKNIRQERRRVSESGVSLRCLDGHTANAADWSDFTRFYNQTFEEKWGIATFNLPFFLEVANQMPDQILLVLADLEGECIAGSLMYHSDTTLYGRHWGATRQIDGLHFEACYYQGIQYCITQGLKIFEPGAQGEHKIARGFRPTLTRSSHWISDARFRNPIAAHTLHERAAIKEYMQQLEAKLPYRREEQG